MAKLENRSNTSTSDVKVKNTTELKIPKEYLSVSQVNAYTICPMSYYFKYIEKRREKKNPGLFLGNVTHSLLENLYLQKDHGISDKDLEEVDEEDKTKEFLDDAKNLGENMLHSIVMYCKHELTRRGQPIAVEAKVHRPIPVKKMDITHRGSVGWIDLGEISCIGYVDYIDDLSKKNTKTFEGDKFKLLTPFSGEESKNLVLGDYKTGAAKDHNYVASDIQMPFYSYATNIRSARIDNILEAKIKFKKNGEPRKDNVPPSYRILKYSIEAEEIKSALYQISQAAIGIGSGNFTMCHWKHWKCSPRMCSHWEYCRGKDAPRFLEKVAEEKFQGLK